MHFMDALAACAQGSVYFVTCFPCMTGSQSSGFEGSFGDDSGMARLFLEVLGISGLNCVVCASGGSGSPDGGGGGGDEVDVEAVLREASSELENQPIVKEEGGERVDGAARRAVVGRVPGAEERVREEACRVLACRVPTE